MIYWSENRKFPVTNHAEPDFLRRVSIDKTCRTTGRKVYRVFIVPFLGSFFKERKKKGIDPREMRRKLLNFPNPSGWRWLVWVVNQPLRLMLRTAIGFYLFQWEPLASSESNGDSRVEVGTGDVADGVDHHHHGQSPHYGYSGQRHHLILVGIHDHSRTAGEYQEVRAQYLRD